MELSAGQLGRAVGAKVEGDADRRITGVAALGDAGPGDLSFLVNPKYRDQAKTTRAGALVLATNESEITAPAVLRSKNPYATFARVVRLLHPEPQGTPGVADGARVDASALLGAEVEIGPNAAIGAGARIGARTRIGAGAVVGRGVVIGEDCRVFPNVTLYDGVTLGSRVVVHAGTVIGADGFGFAKEAGRYLKVPQVGTVVVEDDVEIGANCAIDRAALGRTSIGRGTKIDNLVMIAHNCTIGPDSVLVAQVGISGSVSIGARATLAGQSGVAGHLRLGDDVIVSGKCAVFKDLPDGSFVSGIPARPHRQWLRREAALNRIEADRRKAPGGRRRRQ